MEFMLILRVLARRWWLALLPAVVVAVLTLPQFLGNTQSVSGGYATTFKYSAAQELNQPQRDGDYQDIWLASEFVVNAFTEWIRGSTFRAELATILGDDVDLSGLNIHTDNARSVGVVQMSYPTEAGLQQIVNAALTVLRTRNHDYFPHLGGEPARVTIIDAPVIVPNPPSLPNRFAPFIQIGLGILAGLGLAFLAEYLDPTLRSRAELEYLGVTVLASIPRHRT